MMTQYKEKILIIRLSSIGDVIQASAVPRHLKKHFPQAEIHWVIREDNKDLLYNNPYVTQIIAFHRHNGFKGWLQLCRQLQKSNYTHVYDAHNNIRSHILCFYLKPQYFIRRSKERLKRFLIFYLKLKFLNKFNNGIDTYIEPLKKWGIANDYQGSELYLPVNVLDRIKKLITLPTPLIALAPATAWPKKTWPEKNWKNLIELLLSKTSYHILILGGPNDNFCKNLVLNPNKIQSLQGQLSLIESAAAINFCNTLIAADTGLLHMAEAIGKNVIGIQGPSHLGHTYKKQSITIKESLWCQPCSKDGSGICVRFKYQKCMVDISPERVFESFKTLESSQNSWL